MSHLTLRQLNIFIEVAKHLSISNAARSLHLSQPGVSRQIKNIEVQCNKTLFEQLGKKLYLTEDGNRLLPQAKKIIEQVELFKTLCVNNGSMIYGTLKLSVSIPIHEMIYNILGQFYEKYPHINFDILDGDRHTQLQLLYDNKIDFCVVVNPINKLGLKNEYIDRLPMTFIMSPKHSLAGKNNISAQILAEETFIICEIDSPNYIIIHELFKLIKNKPPKVIQIRNQNEVKHAVSANLGISVLPQLMMESEFKNNLLIPLMVKEFPNPTTDIYWTQHIDKQLSPLTQLFKDFMFKKIRKL